MTATSHAPQLRLSLLDTGYCVANEATMLAGVPGHKIACHAVVGLLQHPTRGWFLFDTGYAPRILDVTARWPARIYRYVTPMRLNSRLTVVNQLGAFGLQPADIGLIVVSHFHADHVAGLLDFPQARFVASRSAWAGLTSDARGLAALSQSVTRALLPPDFAARATLVDDFNGPTLPALGPTHDLFGDGSALLMPLPGHARGQVGLLAQTTRGPVLLAADGAWLSRAYQEVRSPSRLGLAIADDAAALHTTLQRLHDFALARPDVSIVPTHCSAALGRELQREAAELHASVAAP